MKMLIGVDGSPGSLEAVRQAAALTSPQTDELVFYYSPPEVRLRGGSQVAPELLERGRQALADVVFETAKAELPPEFRQSVTTITGTQPPRTGLLAAAIESRADAIAVGARGMGPIERLLLGSVSYTAVTQSHVPVLVARPGGRPAAGGDYRVLVACDRSETDRDIVAALKNFSWPAQSVGQLITVVESMYAGQVPEWLQNKARSPEAEEIARAFEAEFEADKQAAAMRLQELCSELPPGLHAGAPIVAEGHAAEQILDHAAKLHCNLIVVGPRGLGAVARFFLGSTSMKILSEATCSVLLVRHSAKP